MKYRVVLASQTVCYRCGGNLFEGVQVWAVFDEVIDGYKHRHIRTGLCKHPTARMAEHELVMEVIENAKHTPSPKAEADKGNAIEGEEEAKDKRDLPTVRIHLPRHTRTLSTLQ